MEITPPSNREGSTFRREYIPTQPSDGLILEIGAVILRNSRRLRFHLSSACLDKALFMLAAVRLVPG